MPTVDEVASAIEPGSLPYGDRQRLVGMLPEAMGDGPGRISAAEPAEALAGGELQPGGPTKPLTSGLSVGPGAGRAPEQPFSDSKTERLRYLAKYARTPHMRAIARNALRARVRRGSVS